MRSTALLISLFSINGCVFVGEIPKGLGEYDTGESWGFEEEESDVEFTLNPSEIVAGDKLLIEVTSDPMVSFGQLDDVYTLGSVDVLDFAAGEESLEILVTVPADAELGPVTLILEYGDGNVEIVSDAITVLDSEPLPEEGGTEEENTEEGDTGQAESEPE